MTFEEFMQHEEEREKQRRIKRLAEELKPATTPPKPKLSAEEKKAAQRAQLERIMNEAHRRYLESNKRVYELAQPPNGPVPWLVFDRATGELYGEATTLRAHQAWAEVNPMKVVAEKPGKEFLVAVGFNACRCVLRSEWEAAEAAFRKKKANGQKR